ncbi:LTA synthase family protein [Maribacter sp. ACAM166]|uniref:LTA synthase family protein n=1 Tax=Maribacter sp. ACAM166 TaxID=2508996 RepID=UPI0026A172C8|nr:sulfatase-like hydrolase/transferase [Maribacter sp. ACAM166]
MWNLLFPKRYTLLKAFVLLFITTSFLVRLTFLFWDFSEVDMHIGVLVRTFATGLVYDIGTLSMFLMPFLLYLLIFPKKWCGSYLDRISTWFGFFLAVLIIYFSFFGEFTFWEEFQRRFNFIAVDYLIYTYEVVKNINESYTLPLLLGSLITLVAATLFICYKKNLFQAIFQNETTFKQRFIATLPWVAVCVLFGFFINNDQAEWSKNRYNNEISKAGIYSFFAAFRNNELAYSKFYSTIPEADAFTTIKKQYLPFHDEFTHPDKNEIYRTIHSLDTTGTEQKPNVIFICIESLSGKYLNSLGGDQNITPVLDSLVNHSLFFDNLYATGTRTVRGMEAIALSIPTAPGRSIVKRNNNTGLFTIGEVFKEKGYDCNFFYGGDGYFDNMNTFFGGNGFNIVDRGRGFLLDANIAVKRTNIEDDEVTFEKCLGRLRRRYLQ